MPDQFVPKGLLVAPQLFGHLQAGGRPWKPVEATRVAWAWLQHRFVGRIHVAIEEETGGTADFAVRAVCSERSIKERVPIAVDDFVG
jgi:hypothetical protein